MGGKGGVVDNGEGLVSWGNTERASIMQTCNGNPVTIHTFNNLCRRI